MSKIDTVGKVLFIGCISDPGIIDLSIGSAGYGLICEDCDQLQPEELLYDFEFMQTGDPDL